MNSLNYLGVLPLVILSGTGNQQGRQMTHPPVNILFLTADDLNYNSLGCYGSPVRDITPNIDRLAGEGIRFCQAYVNISVSQPSRQSMLTGQYPHTNGATGFNPIRKEVVTLNEILRDAGYLNGIMGKEKHYQPAEKFCWEFVRTESDLASGLGIGRDPEKYYRFTKEFLEKAKSQNRPFFLHANSHDPHRPFAGSAAETRQWGADLPKATRKISENEVAVHGMIPDLPGTRRETAEYYSSVNRCDQTIGAVLKALDESGLADNTLVVFLSDNGMSFPYAKTNCYLNSTRTPLIIRWPELVSAGCADSLNLVSGVDLMPTFLDILELPFPEGLQGRSFMKLLKGKKQKGRDYVFTEFHRNFARDSFPMRAVQNREYLYIINEWSDGKTVFQNESKSGLSFPSMVEAGKTDPAIQARVDFYNHRTREEFYNLMEDPDALNNLSGDPDMKKEIGKFRKVLMKHLRSTDDPMKNSFIH